MTVVTWSLGDRRRSLAVVGQSACAMATHYTVAGFKRSAVVGQSFSSSPTAQRLAGREMPQIHGNWALGDKFLQFCMMLHMGIRYSKTTANKVG